MRLVTATIILDRIAVSPAAGQSSATAFFEKDAAGTVHACAITISATENSKTARLQIGTRDPYIMTVNTEDPVTTQQQRIAEWMVFVVDMTIVINELTAA